MMIPHVTLTDKSINNYHSNGYLLFNNQLFDTQKLIKLSSIFEDQLAEKGSKLSDELDTPHFRDKRLFEFLMAPEVLDLVSQLIGPNIGLWSSHFICKDPLIGRRTPWHEDSSYWNGRLDKLDKIVTIWLAIDDSNLENGCMGVVPGTHINGFSDYKKVDGKTNLFDTEISDNQFNLNDVVWFELNKGECSLHDGRIIHGANANASSKRRCGYTMRYFSLDRKFNSEHPGNANFKIFHCRGENVANNPLVYL